MKKKIVKILLGEAWRDVAQPEIGNPSVKLGQVIATAIITLDLASNPSLAVAS